MAKKKYAGAFPSYNDYDSVFPALPHDKSSSSSTSPRVETSHVFLQMGKKKKGTPQKEHDGAQSVKEIENRFKHFNALCRECLDWNRKEKQGQEALMWNAESFLFNPTNGDDLYLIRQLHYFAIQLFIKVGDPTIVSIPPRVSFILSSTIPEHAGVDTSEEDSEFAMLVATKCSCLPHNHKLVIRVPRHNILEISHPTLHPLPLTFQGTTVEGEALVYLEKTKAFVSLSSLLHYYLKMWDGVNWLFDLKADERKKEELLFLTGSGAGAQTASGNSHFSSETLTFELHIKTVVSTAEEMSAASVSLNEDSIGQEAPQATPFSLVGRHRQRLTTKSSEGLPGNVELGPVLKESVAQLRTGSCCKEDSFVEEQLTPTNHSIFEEYGEKGAAELRTFCATVVNDQDSHLAVKQHHFRVSGRPIGIGGFGAVFRALDLNTGSFVAVKQSRFTYERDEMNLNQREFEMWSMLPSHPNVVTFYGASKEVETNQLLLVLEYASGGSIVSMYHNFRPIPEYLFLRHAKGIALGLKHLHDHGVIHGDVKPENVLTRTDGSVVISDFGCSRLLKTHSVVASISNRVNSGPGAMPLSGTALYMSPEVIMSEPVCKSDVWAYACMLVYLWTCELPWGKTAGEIANCETIPLLFFIASNEDKLPYSEHQLHLTPRWLQKIAARAFEREVSRRCTMTEILSILAEYL